jgi:hypothetical protein
MTEDYCQCGNNAKLKRIVNGYSDKLTYLFCEICKKVGSDELPGPNLSHEGILMARRAAQKAIEELNRELSLVQRKGLDL